MGRKIAVVALVLLGIVLISGCTEPLDEGAQAVKASTIEWLEGEQGTDMFSGGTAGEPLTVWKDGKAFYWIIAIENSEGLHIGNLITDKKDFASPKQIATYKEPKTRLLNYTRDEAYQVMIAGSDYPAYQIEKPILVTVEGRGLSWYSEVRTGGEVLDELYIDTFTLF